MMIGGEESFGLGGYYRTPIEGSAAGHHGGEAEGRDSEPGRRALGRPVRLHGDGHRDEKITKLDLAKEAAHLVVDLLDERNEVGVQSWTPSSLGRPAAPAKDKGAIHHAIATIKAGGGTDGYPA
jgi:hypothetical protein